MTAAYPKRQQTCQAALVTAAFGAALRPGGWLQRCLASCTTAMALGSSALTGCSPTRACPTQLCCLESGRHSLHTRMKSGMKRACDKFKAASITAADCWCLSVTFAGRVAANMAAGDQNL